MRTLLPTLIVIVVGATSAARAGEPESAASARRVSLTFSPLHLLPIEARNEEGDTFRFTILEVTGEYAAARRVGIAGILGGGRLTIDDAGGQTWRFTVGELGAQANYYLVGGFAARHSLHGGVELMYLHLAGEVEQTGVSGVGEGVTLGPYVGYKLATGMGFTFVAQLGVVRLLVQAESSDGGSSSDADWRPLLNLNVGWTF